MHYSSNHVKTQLTYLTEFPRIEINKIKISTKIPLCEIQLLVYKWSTSVCI